MVLEAVSVMPNPAVAIPMKTRPVFENELFDRRGL